MLHPVQSNSIAIFGILVMLSAAVNAQDRAADPAEPPAAAEPEALRIYHCSMPVRELAGVLHEVAGNNNVTVIPEQTNNVLIVRATPSQLEQIDALIQELDQPARRITLTLSLLEIDSSLLVDNVVPAELQEAGTLIRKVRLTSLENQLATVQLGEQRPVVDGVTSDRGFGQRSTYRQEEFGTILSMTARVDDDVVTAELSFEMSRLDDSITATESAGDGIPPARQIVTLQTTVSIPGDGAVLLTDFDSQDDSDGDTRLIGIVTATVE